MYLIRAWGSTGSPHGREITAPSGIPPKVPLSAPLVVSRVSTSDMSQAGHTDPKMTLSLYAKVIASKTDHGAALDGIVGASDWAATGSEGASQAVTAAA